MWPYYLYRIYLISLIFVSGGVLSSLEAKEKKNKYKYQLAISAMIQNEGEWLKEWIEYHRLVGVEHFYLFDNASTDHTVEILKPYINKGLVELFHFATIGENQAEYLKIQQYLMRESVRIAAKKVKWLALIDADEYIVPLQKKSIIKVLKKYEKYGGVYVNWLCFGTSHVQKIPEKTLMIDVLHQCAVSPVPVGKSIVRPERIANCTSPHYMEYRPPFFQVNTNHQTFKHNQCPLATDQLLIYHYYTRDVDHVLNVKIPRRKKWMNIDSTDSYLEQLEMFNASENWTMQRFVPKLKKRILFTKSN